MARSAVVRESEHSILIELGVSYSDFKTIRRKMRIQQMKDRVSELCNHGVDVLSMLNHASFWTGPTRLSDLPT